MRKNKGWTDLSKMTDAEKLEHQKKLKQESYKKLADEAKNKGLCVSCKVNPAMGGLKRCQACTDSRISYKQDRIKQGICPKCPNKAAPGFVNCTDCIEKARKHWSKKLKELRAKAYQIYGHNKCVCCGMDDLNAMELHHINHDGAKHRRELTGGKSRSSTTLNFYYWLERNNWPPILQLLCGSCHNCVTRQQKCKHIIDAERQKIKDTLDFNLFITT